MKIPAGRLRRLIKEILVIEFVSNITDDESGMSISTHPQAGMTGLEVGDVVYLDRDMYLDADILPFRNDFPPVTVVELGNMEQLVGINIPNMTDSPSDWDWMASATGPAFVGSYEPSPGLPTEDLVFPINAINWEYTERGPEEPWEILDKGTLAG